MTTLSEGVQKLIDEPNIGHLVTLMKDGSPQVTPLWIDHDGTHILINTAEGRQKPRNMRRDPRIALSITKRDNPYSYAQIRGRVVDISPEGGWDHICKLSGKYTGNPEYQGNKEETRIIVKILPERIYEQGLS